MSPASPTTPKTVDELVAVIGLGCVLPDANNVAEFWQNVVQGRNSIREVPKDRWDAELYWDANPNAVDKTYTKIGGFITGFRFNPLQFRTPPSVAKSLDETQKWALAAVAECLADAGYDKKPFDRTRTAVILGNAMGGETRNFTGLRILMPRVLQGLRDSPGFRRLPAEDQARILQETERLAKSGLPDITEDTMPGELSNVIAGRIANVFDLAGKNFTTDAACASSLAAIDAAVAGVKSGEFDMVLTGGVDRSMDVATYVKFCKIGALSSRGSFPFDARADGFVMGEGCGILLLKRLSDAIRDGDRIRAVVRGVGSSSDAKGKGITAPNIDGQISCMTRAFADARVAPETLSMLECHGTSTRVGDVVEIQALTRIFGPRVPKKQSIPLGSIKSQIGHLKSAAGAASILKMILALENQVLPPSINFEVPNPNIAWAETPFYVNPKAQPWPEPPAGLPRRCAISSFGFGGTNFNVIIEEYAPGTYPTRPEAASVPTPPPERSTPVSDVLLKREPRHRILEPLAPAARTELLVLGGRDSADLEARVRNVVGLVRSGAIQERNFPSFAAQESRAGIAQPLRLALVVESLPNLSDRLREGLEAVGDPKKRIAAAIKGIYVGEGAPQGRLAMVFPGQGSQYADMMRDLSTRFETVKRTLEQIDEAMTPFLGKPITDFIFLNPAKGINRESVEEALKQTAVTQPAMLTADLALYRLLTDFGVKPDIVAGHSLGEYAALVSAGVMTLEDACIAVSARGREMANVHVPDLGKMASVTGDPAAVEQMLKQVQGYVIPANKNCKVQTVIAGASQAVDAAVEMFNRAGIQAQHIPVSAAFHSEIVAPARVPLARVLERLDVREPKIPILSNVTADYYPGGPGARESIIDLLSRQVASPVEWQRQIERMHQDGARLFVEVGPKTVLTSFTKNILEGRGFVAAGTNHPKRGGFYHFMDALAVLAAWGYPLRFPDPQSPDFSLAAYRETLELYRKGAAAPIAAPVASQPQAPVAEPLAAHRQHMPEPLARLATPAAPTSPSAIERRVEQLGLNLEPVVISGAGVGLPGTHKRVFDDDNFERVLRGENLIEKIPADTQQRMVDKNIVRLVKSDKGDHRFETIRDVSEVIRLAGRAGDFDLVKEFGVNEDFADALEITSKLAIAAALEALRDAGIPLVRSFLKTTTGKYLPGDWMLPEPLHQETGVIFASAFPGQNRLIDEISKYFTAKHGGKSLDELADIYAELIQTVRDPEVRRRLTDWYARHFQSATPASGPEGVYEFNRKFLFHVLSMGHAQVAQLLKAKGPNTQVNAACSSTTQAVGIAEDWIRTGRCKRVLVVGADDITNPVALDWFASGFLAAGAATTKNDVREAALPFDRRRHGMIMGMGAVGLVVEAESEVRARGMEPIVELVASHIANSAYHGSRLDTEHVATEMDRLMTTAERRLGIPRSQIAPELLFMSHETYTPARGGSAAAEIEALRKAFGPDANKVVVSNTKGFTGHPMGASIEDAIAIKSLQRGRVPPIANLKEPDPALGDLNLSRGGSYDLRYALRLAAGFGSQIAFLLLKLRSKDEKRIVDAATYRGWVTRMSGNPRPELEVVNRTLRIKSTIMHPLAETLGPEPRPVSPTPSTPEPPAPVPFPAAPRPPVPVLAAAAPEVQERIIALIADKTGYPRDMLDANLDLEADLGIDTVKQAELFGLLRDNYRLPREEGLQLREYPTIAKIAKYITTRLGAAGAAGLVAIATPAAPAIPPVAPPFPVAPPTPFASIETVQKRLVELVAEKTGYPPDMLDPNLDLEADLGIDTVKQAEIFGLLRESYRLPRDENLQLKDYPTLSKISLYIATRLGPSAASPHSSPVPATPAAPSAPAATPIPSGPAAPSPSDLQARVIGLIAEKTGYPADMLDPDLDLEADLGIDTVKQAELFGQIRESYHLAREEGLQLKDYPTIAKITQYIAGRLGDAPAASAPRAAPPVPLVPSTVPWPAPTMSARPTATVSDRGAVVARIRGVVAEKTGYPPELLEENLDLEADLGIDTVKQAELFGLVREEYGIARLEDVQLSNYNTLGKVADFVLEQAGKAAAPQPAVVQKKEEMPPPASGLRRYVVQYQSLPEKPQPSLSLQQKSILVWAPTSYITDLQRELGLAGASPVGLAAHPSSWAEARASIDQVRKTNPRISGLLYVPDAGRSGLDFGAADVQPIKALFWLLKSLLATGRSGEFEFFGAATFLGGDFANRPAAALDPLQGAFAGLAKALQRELPNLQSKVVDFSPRTNPAAVAAALVQELQVRDGWVEIGTLGGRGTLKLVEEPLGPERPGLELGPNDLLVVSGGGSGITAEACLGIAQRWRPKFLLLGRTALPANVQELAAQSPAEWNALRVRIADDLKAKGERATPVQVERELGKFQRAAEIHSTLQKLRGLGSNAEYRSCDVTDPTALEAAVAAARESLGAVTGLIHAAGIEESKLIVDKTPESFDRVFDVKVVGLRNLLASTRADPVRFLVAFSSIAGRFGNAGQADYSAANDVLAKAAHALRQERGAGFAATTIDWSAWAEKGMATRGSVMAVLNEAGVAPIPLAEGVDQLVQELAHGMRDAEVVVASELGRMADSKLFAARGPGAPRPQVVPRSLAASAPVAGRQTTLVLEPPRGAPERDALLEDIVSQDDRGLVARMILDPERDPYLRDHAVDGVPYLPGVFGVEAFAEAAQRLAPGLRFVGARDVEYLLPAKVLRNQPLEVTVQAAVAQRTDDQVEVACRLQSVFVNARGDRLGAPRVHFTATILMGEAPAPAPEAVAVPSVAGGLSASEIYQRFFHGPSFQVLDSAHVDAAAKQSVGAYSWPQSPLLGRDRPAFLTNPMGRELAYQTAGAYDLFALQALALPKAVRRIRFVDAPRPGERVVAVAQFRETRDHVSRYDVRLVGDRGRVLEELQDFQLVRIRSLTQEAAPQATPVYRARWGRDFPVPLSGARAVIVRQSELAQVNVRAEEALTSGERADQERYRNEKRAAEFFTGRLAAKEAIALLTDRPVHEARGIEIRRLETGEPAPRGKGTENVLVSITHSGDLAIALAARRGPLVSVGIDAERVESKSDSFVNEAFAPEEQRLLGRLTQMGRPAAEGSVLLWAVKEAILKALGKGFALDLHDVRVEAVDEDGRCQVRLEAPAQRALAEVGARTVQVRTWTGDEHAYAVCWSIP